MSTELIKAREDIMTVIMTIFIIINNDVDNI